MIDTHCHLNDMERVPEPDRWVSAALEAGVEKMVVVGIDLEWSRRAVALADRFPSVYAVVGHHPTSPGFVESDLEVYAELWQHSKVVAIGEMGFDFYWDTTSVEEQERAFRAQMDLAVSLEAPVVIHCREAQAHLGRALIPYGHHRQPVHHHCFAGDADQADALGSLAYFGVDGPLTYPKAHELRATVRQLPRDRVVLETDAPWLPPVPYRGKPNQPAYLVYIAEELARQWETSVNEVNRITTENAHRMFPKLRGA